jgi:hypothetical protein
VYKLFQGVDAVTALSFQAATQMVGSTSVPQAREVDLTVAHLRGMNGDVKFIQTAHTLATKKETDQKVRRTLVRLTKKVFFFEQNLIFTSSLLVLICLGAREARSN